MGLGMIAMHNVIFLFITVFMLSSPSLFLAQPVEKGVVASSTVIKKHSNTKVANKRMTLADVLSYAYKNNPELKAAVTDKKSKDEALAQAFAEYYPDIALRLSASRQKDRNNGEENAGAGADFTNNLGNDNTATLVITQNIFNGLGTKYKLEAAEAKVLSGRHAVTAKIQEIVFRIIEAYMDLWEAEQKVAIAAKLEKNLAESLNSEYQKLLVGATNRQEYEAKKSAYADAQYKYSDAVSRYKTAVAKFKGIVCMDPFAITEFPNILIKLPNSLKNFMEVSLKNNPSLLAAKFNEYAASKQVRVAKSALSPKVDLELSAIGGMTSHRGRRSSRNRDSEKYEKLSHSKKGSLSARLNVLVPILKDGGRSYSDIRQTNNEALKAGFEYKTSLYSVEQNCRSVWGIYNAALDQIKQSEVAVESARITVEGVRKSEELGKVSSTDVIYNERNLLERRQQQVEAKKRLVLAKYQILMYEGVLDNLLQMLRIKTYDLDANVKRVRYAPFSF